MNKLKERMYFKIDGKEFDENDFLLILNLETRKQGHIGAVVAIITDEELNKINLAAEEDLDIKVDDEFIQNKVIIFEYNGDKDEAEPIDLEMIELALDCFVSFSGSVNEVGFDKLISSIKDVYLPKVSLTEFEKQVFEVEGVKIEVIEDLYFISEIELDVFDKDKMMIDAYCYTVPMDGDHTVGELKEQRIRPLLETVVSPKWW